MIIGDFWQPFYVGKNNGGHKARPRKTTIARGKLHLLDSAGAVKLFARLTELMSATLARAVATFARAKRAQKITEYRDTASLNETWLNVFHMTRKLLQNSKSKQSKPKCPWMNHRITSSSTNGEQPTKKRGFHNLVKHPACETLIV